jgi:hypothetical protein
VGLPVPSGCLPLALSDLIIAQAACFVKTFFQRGEIFFSRSHSAVGVHPLALYFIPFWHRWTILLSARPLAQVLLAVGENLPPFLVLPRRGIRGVAGFPAWRACRFSALSASIYIPRQQAAACPTPEDGALGFVYTRWSFGVIAHSLRSPPGKPPATLGVSPLTVLMIPHRAPFVKHFFYFFRFFLDFLWDFF